MDLRRLLVGTAVVGGVLFAHWESLIAMVAKWSQSPMYSYAFTVPFISLYLLWSRRDALARLQPAPSWRLGVPVLSAGLLLLAAGGMAGVQVAQQLAFFVSLLGVVLALFGVPYVRVGWAGLAYLLLMFPIWDPITEPLHWRFQNQSASLGVGLLQATGIPVYRDATTVVLPNVILEVARSCSGVNYLVAVLALGLPLAYLSLTGIWRRVVLVGGAIVVAALSNGLRVALIGALAYYDIGSPLHGPMHVLHGLFVAGIGYVALFAGLHLLSPSSSLSAAAPAGASRAGASCAFHTRHAVGLALLFTIAGTVPYLGATRAVALSADLNTLPIELGAWFGQPLPVSGMADDVPWTGIDAQVRRRYTKGAGAAIDVYVGYLGAQRQSRELASFRTADWHRAASRVRVPLSTGAEISANLMSAGDQGPLALFWYEIDGVVETSSYGVKMRTAWNALVRRRSNGAVILLSLPETRDAPSEDVVRELSELGALVYEALGRQLPGRSASRGETGLVAPVSARLATAGGRETSSL